MTKRKTTEWLVVDDLQVDPDVQRKLNPTTVKRIADNFDEEAIGIPVVSRRPDGSLWIIDGQHRCAAIQRIGLGSSKIECQVFSDISKSDEARRFLGLNTSYKVQAIDKFKARRLAGDIVATEIGEIIEGAGFTISDAPRDGNFAAVLSAERIYLGPSRLPGKHPDVLAWTLDVVVRSWGHTKPAVNGDVMYGLGLVRHAYGESIDADRLVTKLAASPGGATGLLGRARGLREIRGGSTAMNVGETIVDSYNRGLRSGKLSDWRKSS